MTVLDDWFGEREETEVELTAKPTNWPYQPEHLRPVLDLWDELEGPVRSAQSKKVRVNGARQWYEENQGAALELLRRAHRYARDRMLDMNSPGSLLFFAIRERRKQVDMTEGYESNACPECGAGFGTHDRGCSRR